MKKSSFRPRSTSYVSNVSGGSTITTADRSRTARESFSSRKISQVFSDLPNSFLKETSLIDDGKFQGRIKVFSSIKNPDRCMSISTRPNDGRFYAVGLANGTINVYSSKTDNILYTLNNENKNLPFSAISTTCVRFRPCPIQQQQGDELSPSQFPKGMKIQRKFSRTGSLSEVEHFLPPIKPPFSQRRRKSSVDSILGLNCTISSSNDTPLQNNLVSATFTNGSVKTFNFMTEQCLHEMKENREILTMDYSRSGNMLATGGDNGCILVYDVETGMVKCSYEPPFDYDHKLLRTYSIAFHPELESEFVSAGWSKEIYFHDARIPNLLVTKIPGPKICGESLSFHSSGKEFSAAAWGKNEGLFIFDYAMKRPIENIFGSSSKCDSISNSSTRAISMSSKREQDFPSSFLYSARFFMENFIAVCGAFPGSVAVVERNPTGNVRYLVSSLKDH